VKNITNGFEPEISRRGAAQVCGGRPTNPQKLHSTYTWVRLNMDSF